MIKKNLTVFLIITMIMGFSINCNAKKTEKVDITIFHAGSLAKPFKDIKVAFEKKYPQTNILLEAAGSRACARKITDQNRVADVMASADESVIRTLLMPEYANFSINFCSNEMAIMFTDESKYANKITSENWVDILLRNDVEYGHSEPNKDPCGYRTLLVWQLAEKYYKNEGLYQELIDGRPLKNVRPKETDLLALLEAGELDYLFIYRSVAEQHHGKYILLPSEINLGSFELADYYKSSTVELDGKKPGEKVIKNGAPMVYGITVPLNANNPEWGRKFVNFVISEEGSTIMKKNGHPIIKADPINE